MRGSFLGGEAGEVDGERSPDKLGAVWIILMIRVCMLRTRGCHVGVRGVLIGHDWSVFRRESLGCMGRMKAEGHCV